MTVRRGDRRGLTLMEVIVALTVATVTLLAARQVAVAMDLRLTVQERILQADVAAANGEWQLRELVADARSGSDATARFGGDGSSATFDTWCRVPAGWKERCRATIDLRSAIEPESTSTLALAMDDTRVILVRTSGWARLLYLDDPSFGGRWVATWSSGPARPVAVGLASATDTLLFPTVRVP